MSKMFWYCYYKLTSIYVSDRWNTQSVTDSEDMFLSCYDLSGGNGTEYSSSHKDAEYARIDKEGQPGYFTASVFTAQPEDAYGTIGENAVFTVNATGKNLKYQWQYNNGHGWKNSGMTGCKTATLTVPATAARNGQQYRCIVTGPCGITEISKEVKLTVK